MKFCQKIYLNDIFAIVVCSLTLSIVAFGQYTERKYNNAQAKAESIVNKYLVSKDDRLSIEAHFSPPALWCGGVQTADIREIDKAKHTIYIWSYNFTNEQLATSIQRAVDRGVKVSVIVDKSSVTLRNSKIAQLATAGADIRVDYKHDIQHSKVMVIDRNIVITGSYNWTDHAETGNSENQLIIRDCPNLADVYLVNFKQLSDNAVSKPYSK